MELLNLGMTKFELSFMGKREVALRLRSSSHRGMENTEPKDHHTSSTS